MAQSIQELRQILVAEAPTSGKGLALTEAGVIPPQAFGATVQDQQRILNVLDFGAKASREDNASSLQLAMDAAESGETVLLTNGSNYKIKSRVTIPAGVRVDMHGATVTKGAAMTTEAFLVSGADVEIRGGTFDGNRAAGATGGGVKWTGARGVARDVTATGCSYSGFEVVGASAVLEAHNCKSTSNGTGTVNSADGFTADAGGVMKLYNCVGSDNDRAGFFVNGGDGSHIDGYAANNTGPGLWVYTANNGTVGTYHGYDNGTYDCTFDDQDVGGGATTPSGWDCGTLIVENNGHSNPQAAGIGGALYLIACKRNRVGTLIVKDGIGWAAVFAEAEDCSVGVILADQNAYPQEEAAVTFQANAKNNYVGYLSCRNYSRAVTISEEYSPFNNDRNVVGEIHCYGSQYGVLDISGGSHNRFGRVYAYDCATTSASYTRGLVDFYRQLGSGGAAANDVQGNVVEWFEHILTGSTGGAMPWSLVHCDADVSRNYVLDGVAACCVTDVIDENGGNHISLRPLKRVQQIEALDSGWTNGASNTTAGQFIEGTGGWKRVSSTAGTDINKAIASIDLSGMASTDWFRVTCYVENYADAHAANPVILRFASTADVHYYQATVTNNSIRKDGLTNLFFRKSDFAATGSPNWAAIVNIKIFVVSAAANTFTVTFDDLVRTERSQFGNHLGATIPFGGASGDVKVATGKVWVNDAGTWKSATVA